MATALFIIAFELLLVLPLAAYKYFGPKPVLNSKARKATVLSVLSVLLLLLIAIGALPDHMIEAVKLSTAICVLLPLWYASAFILYNILIKGNGEKNDSVKFIIESLLLIVLFVLLVTAANLMDVPLNSGFNFDEDSRTFVYTDPWISLACSLILISVYFVLCILIHRLFFPSGAKNTAKRFAKKAMEDGIRFCPECGGSVPANEFFCPKCHHKM